jgi:hypothetical protein
MLTRADYERVQYRAQGKDLDEGHVKYSAALSSLLEDLSHPEHAIREYLLRKIKRGDLKCRESTRATFREMVLRQQNEAAFSTVSRDNGTCCIPASNMIRAELPEIVRMWGDELRTGIVDTRMRNRKLKREVNEDDQQAWDAYEKIVADMESRLERPISKWAYVPRDTFATFQLRPPGDE